MRWFKKRSVDERIENTKNKLYKEVYILVVALCLISIFTKDVMYGIDASNVTTEIVILIGTSLYYGIRSAKLGLYSDEVEVHDQNSRLPMTAKNAVIGGGLGLAIALFFGLHSAVSFADSSAQSWEYFFLVFFISLVIYLPLFVVVMLLMHTTAYKASQKANQKANGNSDE